MPLPYDPASSTLDPCATNENQCPHARLCKLFIDAGAVLNVRGGGGLTPLEMAYREGHFAVAKAMGGHVGTIGLAVSDLFIVLFFVFVFFGYQLICLKISCKITILFPPYRWLLQKGIHRWFDYI